MFVKLAIYSIYKDGIWYYWFWIAVDRYAKEFVNFFVGDRSARTGKELWKGIKNRAKGFIMTDYWKPYENFVPKDQHIQTFLS